MNGVDIDGPVVCEQQFVSPTCHGGNAEDHADGQLDLGALQTHAGTESVSYYIQRRRLS